MLRNYEMALIVDSQLQEDGVEKTVQRYRDLITTHEGSVHRTDTWGVRKLAYEIRKQQQAHYTFVQFQGQPATLEELDRACRMDDSVLRHLVISIKELTVEPEPEPEPEPEEAPADVEADAADEEDADAEDANSGDDSDEDSEGSEE